MEFKTIDVTNVSGDVYTIVLEGKGAIYIFNSILTGIAKKEDEYVHKIHKNTES